MLQRQRQISYTLIAGLFVLANQAIAGRLAIVIDDFGYRPHNENQILALPVPVSVSVLPNAPHAREMAIKAHKRGHEVLIHIPMAPISKQPLEKDTLFPDMPADEIRRIIEEAVQKVPYAVGMNNHMGSAMTGSLGGMEKVMQVLKDYNLYFLDSRTISGSQVTHAAQGTGIKVITRDVFLDDKQQEADIRQQFHRAISLAQRNGSAIAIGHPHPVTVRVLQQMLGNLPADIQLTSVHSLLDGIQQSQVSPLRISVCKLPHPLPEVTARRFLIVLWQSIRQSVADNFQLWRQDLQKK